MDTDSFIVYIKAKDIYWNIVKDVKTRFDTSSYALDRPLPKVKDKKVIELIRWKSNYRFSCIETKDL